MEDKNEITVEEALTILQMNGIKWNKPFLMQGLRDRAFPFGIAVEVNQWVYKISRKKLYQFIGEWV